MVNEADITQFSEQCKSIFEQTRRDIVGMQDIVESAVIAMIAGGNVLHVVSGGRYKLFTEGVDYVKILSLSGTGFIKWARGELPLSEGDIVAAEQPGEYEINGLCTFTAIRK